MFSPVILESPFKGKNKKECDDNITYGLLCLRDCIYRYKEAPMASHLLYTRVLDDNNPYERKIGISAGLSWLPIVDKSVIYIDRGISSGMKLGIQLALINGKKIEFRSITVGELKLSNIY